MLSTTPLLTMHADTQQEPRKQSNSWQKQANGQRLWERERKVCAFKGQRTLKSKKQHQPVYKILSKITTKNTDYRQPSLYLSHRQVPLTVLCNWQWPMNSSTLVVQPSCLPPSCTWPRRGTNRKVTQGFLRLQPPGLPLEDGFRKMWVLPLPP